MAGYMQRFEEVGIENISKLIEKHQNSEFPLNCVVYSSFLPSVLGIAKKFGLMGAAFFITNCAFTAVHYHLRQGIFSTPVEPTIELSGLPLLRAQDLPTTITSKHSHEWLQVCLNQFSNIEETDWLLCNTFEALEDKVVHWMGKQWPEKTLSIGPCIRSVSIKNIDNNISSPAIEWLNTKPARSVLYISFGSIAGGIINEEQTAELGREIKSTNIYFLWIVGSADKHKIPAKFIEETSEKGIFLPWCPQLEVLAHGAVGVFLTHCGWNSVQEGLGCGVPMVAMPLFLDQTINSKFIEDVWRVGVRVKKGENGMVGREDIENSVKDVMVGEKAKEITGNANMWMKLAEEALIEGGSSDRDTDKFISKSFI